MEVCDVTVIGELNIDLLLNGMSAMPETGKEIIAEEMQLSLGSSSAIFASNLSLLGAKVQFIGKLGDDLFGRYILKQLAANKVRTLNIQIDPSLKSGATIIINQGQNRSMITYPGAMEAFGYKDIDWQIVKKSKHLHISSVFLQPGIRKHIVEIFKDAKSYGLTTSLDTQFDPAEKWDLPLNEILPYVDVFLPNEAELLSLTNTTLIDDAIAVIDASLNIMVVKMGEKGSLLINGRQRSFVAANKQHIFVDAIGAGDSFNAGFIFKFLQNEPLDQCQRSGSLAGAISTTASGGTEAFLNSENIGRYANFQPGCTAC